MKDFLRSKKNTGAVGGSAPKFSKLVRRNLRANKRSRRPSWTPIEEPFVERPPELIEVSEPTNPGAAED